MPSEGRCGRGKLPLHGNSLPPGALLQQLLQNLAAQAVEGPHPQAQPLFRQGDLPGIEGGAPHLFQLLAAALPGQGEQARVPQGGGGPGLAPFPPCSSRVRSTGTRGSSRRYSPRSFENTCSVAAVTSSFRRVPNMPRPRAPVRYPWVKPDRENTASRS